MARRDVTVWAGCELTCTCGDKWKGDDTGYMASIEHLKATGHKGIMVQERRPGNGRGETV